MKPPLKLSAVTATRNRAASLPRCIESVAQQTHTEKEHIIIDGASTDGTVEILKTASARYPHIRWISEPDSGPSQAMNKGLAMATGHAVAVIGDDDFYEPDAFEVVAAEFLKYPTAGIIAGHCRFVRNDASTVRVGNAAFTSRADLIECWKYWGRAVFLPGPTSFISRSALDKVGGFEERDRYAMDYRHWIKITEHFDVRIIDKVLANFRLDEGNISFSSQRQQWNETIAISKDNWGSPFRGTFYKFLHSYIRHCRLPLMRNHAKSRLGRIRRLAGLPKF